MACHHCGCLSVAVLSRLLKNTTDFWMKCAVTWTSWTGPSGLSSLRGLVPVTPVASRKSFQTLLDWLVFARGWCTLHLSMSSTVCHYSDLNNEATIPLLVWPRPVDFISPLLLPSHHRVKLLHTCLLFLPNPSLLPSDQQSRSDRVLYQMCTLTKALQQGNTEVRSYL